MATVNIAYGTRTTFTLTGTSLGSSTTFVAGQESTEIDNSTNKYDDALVQGKTKVGSSGVAAGQLQLWVWGSDQSAVSANLDTIAGADGNRTLTSTGIRDGLLKLGAVVSVDSTTANRVYYFGAFSVAQLFGGNMPKYWGIWLTHNTTAALSSTAGDHVFAYTGITYTVA